MKDKHKTVLANESAPYSGAIKTDVMSFDYLIGKVFTHSELLGLTDRQLTAYKSTLRQMFWDWYNRHMDNPHGFADPSRQARVEAGIEFDQPKTTYTTTSGSSFTLEY